MLASLKTITTVILKSVPKATSKFFPGFPSLWLVDFLQCTFMADFRNNFQAMVGTHAEITDLILKSLKKYSPRDIIPLMDGAEA